MRVLTLFGILALFTACSEPSSLCDSLLRSVSGSLDMTTECRL